MSDTSEIASLAGTVGMTPGRLRLLEAALALFSDRGFHDVSMRDLAAEVGITAGSIYAHVSSKQELLFELVRLAYEQHRNALNDALLEAGSDPAERMRRVVRAHVLSHLTYQQLSRVAEREARALTPEQADELSAIRLESERILIEVAERGAAQGQFSQPRLRLALTAIGSMGVRTAEWWTPDHPDSPAEIANAYADFALQLLAQMPDTPTQPQHPRSTSAASAWGCPDFG